MAETMAELTTVERTDLPLSGGLVCDAPADADEVLASIPVWPRWIGLTLAFAISGLLWAAIVLGARWAWTALV